MKQSRRKGKSGWFPNPTRSMPGWREHGKWDGGYWPEDPDALDAMESRERYNKNWKLNEPREEAEPPTSS